MMSCVHSIRYRAVLFSLLTGWHIWRIIFINGVNRKVCTWPEATSLGVTTTPSMSGHPKGRDPWLVHTCHHSGTPLFLSILVVKLWCRWPQENQPLSPWESRKEDWNVLNSFLLCSLVNGIAGGETFLCLGVQGK